MEQMEISFAPERRIFTVAEITLAISGMFESAFSDVWISGEISGAKRAASGHYYFTLKDAEAQLQCACWRTYARLLRFKPEDGIAVLARGRIEVYPPRGQYQLIVEALEPQGYGALQLAFEQLKKKLDAEGLFAAERKRPLPPYPRRIGLVTSPSGAAIRDLVQVLTRRLPGVHIRLYPASVQGAGSAEAVVEGLEYFGRSEWADVVIIGRGGGSIEDLWTFNEESVARAIAACPIPVVSAVGHETDFTIADFVADLRAPTPSAAAEMIAVEQRELLDRLTVAEGRMAHCLRYHLADGRARLHERGTDRAVGLFRRRIGAAGQRIDDLGFRLRDHVRARLALDLHRRQELDNRLARRDLRLQLAEARRWLERADTAAASHIRSCLLAAGARLTPLAAQLGQLSPLAVLERGYAIVQDPSGRVVKSVAEAPRGSRLGVRLSRGRLGVVVEESEEPGTRR